MQFVFLKDRPAALPQVARWYYEQWGRFKPGRSLNNQEMDLAAYLNTDKLPLLKLAVDGETVMGAAQLKYREMRIYPEKAHWLGGVYVDPVYRGGQVATRLVSHMIEVARTLDLEILYLQTEALTGGLYASLGWQALERVVYDGSYVCVMQNDIRMETRPTTFM